MKFSSIPRWGIPFKIILPGIAMLMVSALSAVETEDLAQLRAQIEILQKRLDQLESREKKSAVATVSSKGLVVETPDKSAYFRVSPRIQVDARFFEDDAGGSDGFELRRVRPVFRGKVGDLSWRFMPELAGTMRILDAWGDLDLGDAGYVRVGKFKGVIGLERLQSFSRTVFLERGLPSVLTPTREMGIEYHLGGKDSVFEWTLGLYNGSLDDIDLSANVNLDGSDFDLGARLAIRPWIKDKQSPLYGLTFGAAVESGQEATVIDDSDRDRRIRYRTTGRNTFFRYNNGVEANGDRLRVNPFVSYYKGPFGLLTEYVLSSQEFTRGDVSRTIDAEGFTVQANWVITGEDASFDGVKPKKPFSLENGNLGAFEIGLRYNQLTVEDEAFAGDSSIRFATSNSVQEASAYGLALTWHLSRNLLTALNYEITDFSGLGTNRPTEKVIVSRFQIDF